MIKTAKIWLTLVLVSYMFYKEPQKPQLGPPITGDVVAYDWKNNRYIFKEDTAYLEYNRSLHEWVPKSLYHKQKFKYNK